MQWKVARFDLYLIPLRTRMPFRYGIATMTEMPLAFLRLKVHGPVGMATGIASDLLPPKWFTKVADKPLAVEIDEMLRVIRHAAELALGLSGETPFHLWRELYRAQSDWAGTQGYPPLLAHFGTSLVERALIESACRETRQPFAKALRSGALGFDLGEIHSELAGSTAADLLPAHPLPRVSARHTVGLSDPLTDDEVASGERLDDGLPQSLASCIRTYGLRHFKIKVHGKPTEDIARLVKVAGVLHDTAKGNLAITLDGNEQFRSVTEFRSFWEGLRGRPELNDVLRQLLFVEQPLHRDCALEETVGQALREWKDRPPMIIDESDGTLDAARKALALGYAGTSHKNCKGVFKGVANRCLLAHHQRTAPGEHFIMSGEDLCNVGPVALLQDLAVMAALGIESVERNGHHYNAGLSQLPRPMQDLALRHHPDLYQRSRDAWPTLRITEGEIDLGTINAAPCGVGFVTPLEGAPVASGAR